MCLQTYAPLTHLSYLIITRVLSSKTVLEMLNCKMHGVPVIIFIYLFLPVKRTADTINSLEALANQDDIKYGVKDGGSVYKFFEKSEDSLYRKMFSHMREYKTFVKDTKTGVARARTDQYAYITEYPYLEYYNQQKPCNTRLLKNLIQTKSYGIGLQRNSPYTNRITVAILKVSIIGGTQ